MPASDMIMRVGGVPWAGPPGMGVVCVPMPPTVARGAQGFAPVCYPAAMMGASPVIPAFGYVYPSAEMGFRVPAAHPATVLPMPKRPVPRRSLGSRLSLQSQPPSELGSGASLVSTDSFGKIDSLALSGRSESNESMRRNDSAASVGMNDSFASTGKNESMVSMEMMYLGGVESFPSAGSLASKRPGVSRMSFRSPSESPADWVGQIEVDKEGLWNRERIILGVKAVFFKGIMGPSPREREEVRRLAQEWCGDTALLDTIMKRCPNRSFEGYKVVRESRSGRYVYSLVSVHYSGPTSLMGADLVPCRKRKR